MSGSRTLGGKNQTPLSSRSSGKRKRPRDRAVHSQTGSQKTHTSSSSLDTPESEPPRPPWEKRRNRSEDSGGEVAWAWREQWPQRTTAVLGGPGGRGVALGTLSGRRGPPRRPHHRPRGPLWRLGGAPARGLREQLLGARGSSRTSQHLLDPSSESCSCGCSLSARVWAHTSHQIT